DSFSKDVKPFLKKYCLACHGAEKQKGDRRLDTLGTNLATEEAANEWQDIIDQLNLGTMPPKNAPQPRPGEKQPIINWMMQQLATANEQRKNAGGPTTLRRLNRVQYYNTVRDLLSLPDLLVDPTESFPPDETLGQFDNIGSTLVMSDFLLQKYS